MSDVPLTEHEIRDIRAAAAALEEHKKVIENKLELVAVAARLTENKDFINLFEERYFKDEIIRFTSMLHSEEDRTSSMESLMAISKTQEWFNTIKDSSTLLNNELEDVNSRIQDTSKVLNYGIGW